MIYDYEQRRNKEVLCPLIVIETEYNTRKRN